MNLRTRLVFVTAIALPILCIYFVGSLINEQHSNRLVKEKRLIRYQPLDQPLNQ